jgi:hypothetical protein
MFIQLVIYLWCRQILRAWKEEYRRCSHHEVPTQRFNSPLINERYRESKNTRWRPKPIKHSLPTILANHAHFVLDFAAHRASCIILKLPLHRFTLLVLVCRPWNELGKRGPINEICGGFYYSENELVVVLLSASGLACWSLHLHACMHVCCLEIGFALWVGWCVDAYACSGG